MNETRQTIPQASNIVQWLQQTFIQVPGTVSVSFTDIYTRYKIFAGDSSPENLLSKRQVGQIVSKLFDKVHADKNKSQYKGLRLNFFEDQACDDSMLKSVAHDNGFFQMNSSNTYGLLTGYTVNGNELMKIITIMPDSSFTVSMGCKKIDLNVLGLNLMKANTKFKVQTLFNTVKQSTVCCGKQVQSKHDTTKYTLVQEWTKKGDENSLKLRITASKCSGILPFTSISETCIKCQEQSIPSIHVDEPDPAVNVDRENLIRSLFPGADEIMIKMLKNQSDICNEQNKDSRSRRWDRDLIQIALTLWVRSPQGYSSLRNSGLMILPSESLLQRYKNCFNQYPGLNDQMLEWMLNESIKFNSDKHGGLILDEMSIQEDLKMSFYNGKTTLDGIVNLGCLASNMNKMNTHNTDFKVASHVLQLLFLSYDGFRFPFAYFPTITANTPELYITVWDAVAKLNEYGFSVDYVCFDGATNNRSFQMMHFENNNEAKDKNFTTANPYKPSEQVTLLMDYSHNIKKLRNSIHSSGDNEICKRKLKLGDNYIVWDHWIGAYNWDKTHNPIRVHQKLTNEHVFVNKTSKMRNHLAEEVLDKNMLNLMVKYQESLTNGTYLDKTIELLSHTSKVIDLFRDWRAVADLSDPRLQALSDFEIWLDSWKTEIDSNETLSASNRNKMFITRECYSDIISMIRGFLEICKKRINIQKRSVVPAGINSDVIENFFCQQRTICHGSNSNPSIHQYKFAINSTILGQNAVSKKCNATFTKRKSADPYIFSVPQPLHKKKCIRF